MTKLFTAEEITEKMLDYRAVALGGRITAESSQHLARQLFQLQLESSRAPINLLINSGGGEDEGARFLHDLIAHILTAPVHALVAGQCSSAATFVLLACPVRRCLPHATFVIHSGTIGNISLKMDDVTVNKINRLAQEVQKDAEWAQRFYASKLNLPVERVRELIARGDEDFDNRLSAEEAREIGLITEIIPDKAGIFPPLEKPGE